MIGDLKDLACHVIDLHNDSVRHFVRVLLYQNRWPLTRPHRFGSLSGDVSHKLLHLLVVDVEPLMVHGAAALRPLLRRHVKVHAQVLLPHSAVFAVGLLSMEDSLFILYL